MSSYKSSKFCFYILLFFNKQMWHLLKIYQMYRAGYSLKRYFCINFLIQLQENVATVLVL